MTTGYLLPNVPTPPQEDDDLDALLQAFVVGVTALPGPLVRPRWQAVAPKMPERETNWCSLGVREERADAGPALKQSADGLTTSLQRHELFEVLFSFYGPLGRRFAAMFRDGISLQQNLDVLREQGIFFRDMLPIVPVPELFNNQWFRRYDVSVFFARGVSRTYSVESFVEARANVRTDTVPPFDIDITATLQP